MVFSGPNQQDSSPWISSQALSVPNVNLRCPMPLPLGVTSHQHPQTFRDWWRTSTCTAPGLFRIVGSELELVRTGSHANPV